jgi:hypothetical protein
MKKLICLALLSAFSALNAATIFFNPTTDNDDPSADVNVLITITDTMSGVDILAEVIPTMALPNVGDLRGLFFDLVDAIPVCADVSGADVTSCDEDSSSSGGMNIIPLGPFSLAIEIGEAGIKGGMDDIQKTSLSIANLTTDNFLKAAVRLTSVGEPGGDRELSSKLIPVDPFEPGGEVPEPSTLALIGLGLAGVASKLRRK